ncbi:hypothetical protein N7524_010876, partial [Penicillium chrysogenum]
EGLDLPEFGYLLFDHSVVALAIFDDLIIDNVLEGVPHGLRPTPEESPIRDQNMIKGVAIGRPGSVPGYLLTALIHYPKLFEGMSDSD